jgi:hypothetical protein
MKIFKNNQNSLYIFLIITIVFQFYLIFDLKEDLIRIKCDLVSSINAEREYTYPILRTIDNPNNYGKNILNPITNDKFYYCKK